MSSSHYRSHMMAVLYIVRQTTCESFTDIEDDSKEEQKGKEFMDKD